MPLVTSTYRLPGFDAIEELTNKAIDNGRDESPAGRDDFPPADQPAD